MNIFDPAAVRQAVADFAPPRPQKFQELASAKAVIIELRQKRASYRSIAELLTKHCLPTSKTAVAAYCHEVLGERVRPKRRAVPRKLDVASPRPAMSSEPSLPLAVAKGQAEQSNEPPAVRGPRIAQVRMISQTDK